MVNRAKATKESEESRWRARRLSMRTHGDLKRALEFLAKSDRRTVSQYCEIALVDHVRSLLKNSFDDDGSLASKNSDETLVLRDAKRR
jgi:hypothetical protein